MKGKDKCEFLKGIRKRMAEANGILYEPRECTYEGECTGTCPFCEEEAAKLLAKLRKKEAEGVEIKTDDVGIFAIELGVNECNGTDKDKNDEVVIKGAELATLIEQEKNIVEEQPLGSLMNSYDEDTEIPELPIDPFRGSNNPFMSRKDLQELKQERNNKRIEPLMGDIEDYWKHNEEELHRLQEETICKEMERNKELRGRIREEVYDEEIAERKRKENSLINKMWKLIKNAIGSPLEGELDE